MKLGEDTADESVLLVAHGITLAIITCFGRGISLEKLYDYVPDNAKLSRVKWKANRNVGESIQGKNGWNPFSLINREG